MTEKDGFSGKIRYSFTPKTTQFLHTLRSFNEDEFDIQFQFKDFTICRTSISLGITPFGRSFNISVFYYDTKT